MTTEGKRIKQIRGALCLSQKELASIFGIGTSFIGNVENSKKSLSKKHLYTLLIGYNVNINYILAGIGEMFLTKEKPVLDKLKEEGVEPDLDGVLRKR